MKSFVTSFQARIKEHGVAAVAAALPEWLDHVSRNGSGDDITVAYLALDQSMPT